MNNTRSEIQALIQPLCDSENIILSDVSLQGGAGNTIVKVIVDTEDGITLNQCQLLSKQISDLFYRKDMFKGQYRLEVTSPGIHKPLKESYEFKRNIGKQLKVNYLKGDENCVVTGELIEFSNSHLSLKSEKDTIEIPLKDIEQAKIKLKW